MEAMRQSWTDDRLDDFRADVDGRFDRIETEVRDLRLEMTSRFERVEQRLDDLNGTILRLGGGALVTFAVGFAGLIATQI